MKKRNPIPSVCSFLLAGTLTLSMAACSAAQTPAQGIQPIHARKGDHSVGRRIFARDRKEHLLPAVAVYLRKQTALGAEP